MNSANKINVEVVYPLPNEQKVFRLSVEPDAKVEAIIQQSGILDVYPEIDLAINKVGVFSRSVKLDATLLDKDRIEIYRPLLADPKDIRRKRVEQMKAEKENERQALALEEKRKRLAEQNK